MFKYATNNDELILFNEMIILIALTMAEEVCKESQWRTSKSLESIQNSLARINFTNSIFKKHENEIWCYYI